jgi:hypothetical protein
MKRKISVVCMALVLALSIAAVVGAQSQSPSQFCKDNNDLGFSHDTCVVCVNRGNNAPVCFCKILEDLGLLGAAGFSNLGQCVSTLR